jgi:hypothetical protein
MYRKFISVTMVSLMALFSIPSHAATISGNLSIVNTSTFQLTRVNQASTQMNPWNFPSKIESNTTSKTDIGFNVIAFSSVSDISGVVEYQITCANNQLETISINAKMDSKNSFIEVVYPNLYVIQSGANCVKIMDDNTTDSIGFIKNGNVKLVLANNN